MHAMQSFDSAKSRRLLCLLLLRFHEVSARPVPRSMLQQLMYDVRGRRRAGLCPRLTVYGDHGSTQMLDISARSANSMPFGEGFLYVILMSSSISFEDVLVLTCKSRTSSVHSRRVVSGRVSVRFSLCAGCRGECTRSGSIVNGLAAGCSGRPGSVGCEQS